MYLSMVRRQGIEPRTLGLRDPWSTTKKSSELTELLKDLHQEDTLVLISLLATLEFDDLRN